MEDSTAFAGNAEGQLESECLGQPLDRMLGILVGE